MKSKSRLHKLQQGRIINSCPGVLEWPFRLTFTFKPRQSNSAVKWFLHSLGKIWCQMKWNLICDVNSWLFNFTALEVLWFCLLKSNCKGPEGKIHVLVSHFSFLEKHLAPPSLCFCRLPKAPKVQRDSTVGRKLRWRGCFPLSAVTGSADLPQGHESRHLCSPQPQSLQRAPGFPAGQRRLPASAGHGVPDHPLRPWWPHLPRRRERGQPVLRGVGVTRGHPGRRSGGYSRSD